jgi:hypothetical protein
MLQCRHRRSQCLNVFFLHYSGNRRGDKEVPVRFGTNLTAMALTRAKNSPEPLTEARAALSRAVGSALCSWLENERQTKSGQDAKS